MGVNPAAQTGIVCLQYKVIGEFLFSVSWASKECWVWSTLPWPLPGKWDGTASARRRNCPHLLTSGWSLSILRFIGWEKLQSEMTGTLQGPSRSASSVGNSDICQRNLVAREGMHCGWLLSTGTASLLGVLEVESPWVLANNSSCGCWFATGLTEVSPPTATQRSW